MSQKPSGETTLRDIARHAEEREDAAARALNYRMNRAASALRTGRSATVGVLLPDITNPVFPPILRGIEQALAAEGFFAMVANVGPGQTALSVADRLMAQRVDGLIVATSALNDPLVAHLQKAQAKVVLVNRRDDSGLMPAVVSDDALGMKLAVDHLVSLGHRQIAHLAGPADLSTGALRRSGFEQAMAQQGRVPVAIETCSAYSREAGAEAVGRLWLRESAPTGLVAANDLIALGAITELQRRGIAVPRQVSVVGHNDMPLVDMVCPPLTTVRIQHYEMGYRAARLLLDALRGVPGTASTLVLRPELVVRGSTAPPA